MKMVPRIFVGPDSRCRDLVFLSVLLATLSFGIFLRCYNIDGPGLSGSDAIYYTEIAKLWSEGEFVYHIGVPQAGVSKRVYRPATFFLFALAIEVFGFHDYSIKTMNAIMDSTNILVVFFICYLLAERKPWPALAAAMMYACFPVAIYTSRSELTHTSSVFMVVLSFLFFVLYFLQEIGKKKFLYIILAGVFSGFAALTHEELIFIAPSYAVILLVYHLLVSGRRVGLKRLLVDLAFLASATLFSCLNMILYYMKYPHPHSQSLIEKNIRNLGDHGSSLGNDISVLAEELLSFPEKWGRFLWNSLLGTGSAAMLCLFLLLVLIAAARGALHLTKRKLWNFAVPHAFHLPLAVVLVHLAFLAYFIPFYPLRIFLPLVPLVLISIALWYAKFLEHFSSRYAAAAALLLALVIIFFNTAHYPGYYERQGGGFSRSWTAPTLETDVVAGIKTIRHFIITKSAPRFWYDLLGDRVNENARLLVTSSIMHPFPGRRALQVGYYFGDNAIYIIDHDEPLEMLIEKYRIKFVLISAYHATGSFRDRPTYQRYEYDGKWRTEVPLRLGECYGFRPGQYSLEEEFRFLTEYLERRRSKIVHSGGPAHPTQLPRHQDLVAALLTPEFSYVIYEL